MRSISQRDKDLLENLFVLELANNHWGKLECGLKIIRDIDEFIHPYFKDSTELRYVEKTEDTRLSKADFSRMDEEICNLSYIPMATPFDETSVDLCIELGKPILKIASSDMNDWPLIEKIASTRRPTIISTGGASERDLDDVVRFFERRALPWPSTVASHSISAKTANCTWTRSTTWTAAIRATSPACPRTSPRLAFFHADFLRQGRAHLGAAHPHSV